MKYFSSFTRVKEMYAARHEPENLRPLAESFWRMLLMIALLLMVGAAVFGVWKFIAVVHVIGAANGAPSSSRAALDRNRLDRFLSDLNARRASFEAAANAGISTPDPSR
jgi:hypothetical protein